MALYRCILKIFLNIEADDMMMMILLLVLSLTDVSVTLIFFTQGGRDVLGGSGEAVGAVLRSASQPRCSVILLTDGTFQPHNVFKMVGEVRAPWGVGVFEVAGDGQDDNVTQAQFSQVVGQARLLRQVSWCVTVVVVSDDPAFLTSFSEWSLKRRLLAWSTRLLVVTRLPLPELKNLLSSHWTYSMMNTMFLRHADTTSNIRCVVYCHIPYSPRGAETVTVASWSPDQGLTISPQQNLFPEKFTNFHGMTVNITGLSWRPYFTEYEEKATDGTSVKNYKGPDGLMFVTIADTLNFTYSFLPVSGWIDAADKVVERKSLMLVISHVLLQTRAERYDFTFAYTFTSFGFGLAKPVLKPQWQSLYYPLADEVWASTLAALLLMPGFMYMISKRYKWSSHDVHQGKNVVLSGTSGYHRNSRGFGAMIQELFGSFTGQTLSKWLPRDSPSRILMAVWLVFAFIFGTVYRGNLTAALTLPKYPPRPETVEELVDHVNR
ncbi:ionotropic receptor 21a-like [Panulirus ornatus]|uniref:ionotropic receptor 21a-like n=1 Tax=Panulirus ornatus TaxID=150431 RepID=UPI003A8875E9